jgi:uncharacterized protein DUF3352
MVGDSGSGSAPGGSGDRKREERKSHRGQVRRRLGLSAGGSAPAKREVRQRLGLARGGRRPAKSLRRGRPKLPSPPDDLWFRLRTRLRAVGYWLGEKRKIVWRRLVRTGEGVAYWWSKRSRGTRIRIFTVAGIVVLYLVVKFLPVPGVPCEISAAKECAPSNETIAFVPRDTVLYAHMTVNSDSHQWELARDLRNELPEVTLLVRNSAGALASGGTRPLNVSQEVFPWAKDDLALIGVPGPKGATPEAYVAGVGDSAKADRFLASISPPGKTKQPKVDGVPMTVHVNGFASARSGDELVFGNVVAVRAALAAKSGHAPRLEDSDQGAVRDGLPDVRLAEVYLSRAGVQRLLAGRQGAASQLDTFVDYGATTGMAASVRIHGGGIEVNVVSELDPKLEQRNPNVFADLPQFSPALANEASSDALGYIGVGDLGPALTKVLANPGAGAQGLAGSVRALAQSLKQQAGVDLLKDLLPALGGQAALVAEPTGGIPYASLIVDGVDESKAEDALASLQGPIIRSVGTSGPQVPRFQSKDVDGVTVHSVQISPVVNLSYALFDGKLVVSTQPDGIAQVRSSAGNLSGTSSYQDATNPLPDPVSALVFLNLDEVLGLAQQAGLAQDPLYASLSEDISRIKSLGIAVRGSDHELRSELFLNIPD